MAKVYVSSTFDDLKEERQAVFEWLVKSNHQPVHSYRPDSETVRDSCLDDIDKCDLYLLILGHRYGSQPEDGNPEKLSITRLEFRRAGQSGIPRIALLRFNVPDIRLSDLEDPRRSALVFAFREEVKGQVRPGEFKDLQGLIQELSTGIENELNKLRTPSERKRLEVWLAAHLQDLSKQFASHMAASALIPGAHKEAPYLDLVIVRRQMEEKKESGQKDNGEQRYTLEDVLQQGQGPLLVVGEGGCGKTTSLLYTAARAADRASVDETSPVPIFINLARLTELTDLEDLLQLIADSVPHVGSWNELSDLGILRRRRLLFLFDSFNEMPERLQSNATVVLKRFVEKHKDHICVIGSRPVPPIEQMARSPSQFLVFEILRLTSDQVRGFLENLGLVSLYDRMPNELRDLAGNPFMLLAIAQTLAGVPEQILPRNPGKLYESFARGWMRNEESKRSRSLEYSFGRVKEPLLAYLAKRMTSAGLTSFILTADVELEVETQLADIYERIKRRGGMPQEWTVDRFLDEILGDGLLKRVNDQWYFMHQSLQEYFTGVYFRNLFTQFPTALVEFTPGLRWELISTYSVAEVPTHRFVPALLMMTGLLDDGTKIVEALANKNPILAAAASSATHVDSSLVSKLEQNWIDLLEHGDLSHRIVGCSCAILAASRSPRVIHHLVAFAISADFNNSYIGIPALGRLNAPDVILPELVETARSLTEDEFKTQKNKITEAIETLQSAPVVRMLFDKWRSSLADASVRHRFEGLMASVDKSLLEQELQKIRSNAIEPAIASDADQALAEAASWKEDTAIFNTSNLIKIVTQSRKLHADKLAETVAAMRNQDNQQIAAGLHSDDFIVREVAASMAAERRLLVGDKIVEIILRYGQTGLISPLLSLSGEQEAVTMLIERSREKCYSVGILPKELAVQLKIGELSEDVKTELKRLGVQRDLRIDGTESDDGTLVWILRPSSWSGFRPLFKLQTFPDHLEFYDCNIARRAFEALAKIPGETAHTELWCAVDNDDLEIQVSAINALAERSDPRLANRLLARLRSEMSPEIVNLTLDGLRQLHAPEAVALVNDTLVITGGEYSDVHPIWGPCPNSRGWAQTIHSILATLDADSDVQQALDKALAAEDPERKVAALNEFSRWYTDTELSHERRDTWRVPERVQRILDMSLRDPAQSVCDAAVRALRNLKSDAVVPSLMAALSDNAVEMQVAAGDVLISLQADEHFGRIAEVLLPITKGSINLALRRRAAEQLGKIPGGLEPLYRPIQDELGRGGAERALEMIDVLLQILPEDANMYWWRGHALRSLGRLELAADSYQRASELAKDAVVIPQTLAQTFLELGDSPRAMATARRGVELEPGNADVQSVMAWSCFKADAIPDAIEAANKAVELDPVHADAIWILLLAQLRQGDLGASQAAFRHALRVRQLLSPGLDISFLGTFMKEVKSITTDNSDILRLIEEIKNIPGSDHQVLTH